MRLSDLDFSNDWVPFGYLRKLNDELHEAVTIRTQAVFEFYLLTEVTSTSSRR